MNRFYTIILPIILLHTFIASPMEIPDEKKDTKEFLPAQTTLFAQLPEELWQHILSFLHESPSECVKRVTEKGDTRWPHSTMIEKRFSLTNSPMKQGCQLYEYLIEQEGNKRKRGIRTILETDFLSADLINFSLNKKFYILAQRCIDENNNTALRSLIFNSTTQEHICSESPIENINYVVHAAINSKGSAHAFLLYFKNQELRIFLKLPKNENIHTHSVPENIGAKNHSKIRIAFTKHGNSLVIYNQITKEYASLPIEACQSLPDFFHKNLICKDLRNAQFYNYPK